MYLVFIFLMSQIHPYIVWKIIWFLEIHKNTHMIYINHVLIHIILHDSFYLRNSCFLQNTYSKFSPRHIKMLAWYYEKNKEKLPKRLLKGSNIFLKKKKAKSVNMIGGNIDIFLKKKNKRSIKIAVDDIKNF